MPRKANPMVGTQLLVPPDMRDRARALAIVRRESVADTWRSMLVNGIETMETEHKGDLRRLGKALDALAPDRRGEALAHMIYGRLNLDDLYTADGSLIRNFPW